MKEYDEWQLYGYASLGILIGSIWCVICYLLI